MPDLSPEATTMMVLVSSSAVKLLFSLWGSTRNKYVQVGTVTQLNCYPVKSCRGISVRQGLCTPLGLKTGNAVDRHWAVVRSNGDFITQRQFPKMALIQTEVSESEMKLTAPGMPSLRVPLSPPVSSDKIVNCRVWEVRTKAVDVGQEAGSWLSTFLGEPGLRLLWSAPSMPKSDITKVKKPWGNLALPGDQAAFPDYCSYLVATEASLAALNQRLKQPVPMATFRPSIVIAGCPEFDEDNWAKMKIGSASFRMLDPCTRCLLTTVRQDTGQRDPASEPLNTLKGFRCFPKYGASPIFAVNATIDVQGMVKVGDPVYVVRK